jgi:hypothetical protein
MPALIMPLSDRSIAGHRHTIGTLENTTIFPEYPATSQEGYGYMVNVQGLADDEIKTLHRQVYSTAVSNYILAIAYDHECY